MADPQRPWFPQSRRSGGRSRRSCPAHGFSGHESTDIGGDKKDDPACRPSSARTWTQVRVPKTAHQSCLRGDERRRTRIWWYTFLNSSLPRHLSRLFAGSGGGGEGADRSTGAGRLRTERGPVRVCQEGSQELRKARAFICHKMPTDGPHPSHPKKG